MTDFSFSGGSSFEGATDDGTEGSGFAIIRSFVVRALLDRDHRANSAWRGYVTDVATGDRRSWSEVSQVGRIIDNHLARLSPQPGTGWPMSRPEMGAIVEQMLDPLRARIPPTIDPVPQANVTVQRMKESLVGLGEVRGQRSAGTLAVRALRGVRLAATVRFQLWAATSEGVDGAVLSLQAAMLDQEGLQGENFRFLKVTAEETAVAEHVPAVNGWRKTTSYDVLFEFRYADADEALSLIARIPVDTDLEASGLDRETTTVRDDLARWDDEGAAPLAVAGPGTVGRLELLSFIPSPPLTGTITLHRSTGDGGGTPSQHTDLASFLAAVSGDPPAETNSELTLEPNELLSQLPLVGDPVELGDWDEDNITDAYELRRLEPAPALRLPGPSDRFEIRYSTDAGLNPRAVIYLRINPA